MCVACALAALGLGACNLGAPVVEVDTGTRIVQLIEADVNGDGRPDVVAVGQQAYSVALGDGAGGFTMTNGSAPGLGLAGHATVADITGDAKVDLVYTTGGTGVVETRAGDGAGHFSTTRRTLPAWQALTDVVVADLDTDGDADVVGPGPGGVGVWLSNGNGTFAQPFVIDVVSGPYDVEVADVSGDGVPDIVAETSGPDLALLLGDGTGDFALPVSYPTGVVDSPDIALGDLDGDGDLDIVGGNSVGNGVFALLGDGSGGFGSPVVTDRASGTAVHTVTLDDFDGDGHLDVATGGMSVVSFGDGAGHFVDHHGVLGGSEVLSFDYSGDGIADLIYNVNGGSSLRLMRNALDGARTH